MQVLAVPPTDLRGPRQAPTATLPKAFARARILPSAAVAWRMRDTPVRHEAVSMEAVASRQPQGARDVKALGHHRHRAQS
jgi:hypothetical protein